MAAYYKESGRCGEGMKGHHLAVGSLALVAIWKAILIDSAAGSMWSQSRILWRVASQRQRSVPSVAPARLAREDRPYKCKMHHLSAFCSQRQSVNQVIVRRTSRLGCADSQTRLISSRCFSLSFVMPTRLIISMNPKTLAGRCEKKKTFVDLLCRVPP